MQTLRYGHRKIHISKEAFVDEDFENDIDADPDGIDFTPKIYGLVFLDDVKLFHDMLQISACEKRMVRFWEEVSGQKLHGHSYIFSVKDFFAFRTPSLLQELGNSCYRSLMARLEAEQGPVLRCQLQEERDNCDCLAGRATPNVVLRLAFALCDQSHGWGMAFNCVATFSKYETWWICSLGRQLENVGNRPKGTSTTSSLYRTGT